MSGTLCGDQGLVVCYHVISFIEAKKPEEWALLVSIEDIRFCMYVCITFSCVWLFRV